MWTLCSCFWFISGWFLLSWQELERRLALQEQDVAIMKTVKSELARVPGMEKELKNLREDNSFLRSTIFSCLDWSTKISFKWAYRWCVCHAKNMKSDLMVLSYVQREQRELQPVEGGGGRAEEEAGKDGKNEGRPGQYGAWEECKITNNYNNSDAPARKTAFHSFNFQRMAERIQAWENLGQSTGLNIRWGDHLKLHPSSDRQEWPPYVISAARGSSGPFTSWASALWTIQSVHRGVGFVRAWEHAQNAECVSALPVKI